MRWTSDSHKRKAIKEAKQLEKNVFFFDCLLQNVLTHSTTSAHTYIHLYGNIYDLFPYTTYNKRIITRISYPVLASIKIHMKAITGGKGLGTCSFTTLQLRYYCTDRWVWKKQDKIAATESMILDILWWWYLSQYRLQPRHPFEFWCAVIKDCNVAYDSWRTRFNSRAHFASRPPLLPAKTGKRKEKGKMKNSGCWYGNLNQRSWIVNVKNLHDCHQNYVIQVGKKYANENKLLDNHFIVCFRFKTTW